jgi:hypothetical protein
VQILAGAARGFSDACGGDRRRLLLSKKKKAGGKPGLLRADDESIR